MSKSNTFEQNILALIFNNTNIANIGDAAGLRGASAEGNLYVRLHTDAVIVSDSNIGTEATYTGYNTGGSKTLFRLVNQCAPEETIREWFETRYITASGVYLRGLELRRKEESDLFFTPIN